MSTIIYPLKKAQNIISRIGEKLVEEYFKQHGILIAAQEFELKYVGARADFIITRNEDKKEHFFAKVDEIEREPISKGGVLLEEFTGKKFTRMLTEDLIKLRYEIAEKYPEAVVFYLGNQDSLRFYDRRPLEKTEYDCARAHRVSALCV